MLKFQLMILMNSTSKGLFLSRVKNLVRLRRISLRRRRVPRTEILVVDRITNRINTNVVQIIIPEMAMTVDHEVEIIALHKVEIVQTAKIIADDVKEITLFID